MAIRGTSEVKLVGLPQIAKKLDTIVSLTDARAIVHEVGALGQETLRGFMPTDWNRPRQISLQETLNSARITLPRDPYIFFERGSSPNRAGRAHRTKTERQFKEQGYRIRPRRYIRRTNAIIRKAMRRLALERGQAVQKAWSA